MLLLASAVAAAQVVAPSERTPREGGPADPESPGAVEIRPLESVVPNPRSKADARPLAEVDARFLQWVRRTTQARVDAGRLAAHEGAHPCVRKYAERVVEQLVGIIDEIDVLAASHRLSLSTTLDAADRKLLADLQRLTGPSFDRRFADAMQAAQQRDLARLRGELGRSQDDDVRSLARRALPPLEEQVAMAGNLVTMVGRASGSALPQGFAATGCAAF